MSVTFNRDVRDRLRRRGESVPNNVGGDFSVTTVTPEIAYRLLHLLALAVRLPVHHKVFDETLPMIHREETGLGDLEVVAHADVLELDLLDGLRVTLSAGFTLPIGSTEAQPFVGSFAPTPLQLGSGTFDSLLAMSGAIALMDHFRLRVAAAGRLALYENSHDYRAASVFEASAEAAWRVLPDYVALNAQLLASHVTKVQIGGELAPNTGRDALYVAPGVELGPFFGFSLGASARVPLVLHVNETQFAETFLFEARLAYRSPPLFGTE